MGIFHRRLPADHGQIVPVINIRIDLIDQPAVSRFLAKLRRTSPDGVSPREDQAFLLLLSMAVLNRQFIRRQDMPPPAPHPPLTRVADLSGQR